MGNKLSLLCPLDFHLPVQSEPITSKIVGMHPDVQSYTWVFQHPVTSDKNLWLQSIIWTLFAKKNLIYSETCHFRHLTLFYGPKRY